MRPTISETLVGGRSRKISSANVTDSYVAGGSGSALLGSTPSMEELHAPSTSTMTYFLADEATVNAASMTKSSDSLGSTGVFGVQSLSSSRSADTSGTGNFGKEVLSVIEHKGVVGKGAPEYGGEGEQEGEGRNVHVGIDHMITTNSHQEFSALTPPRGKLRDPSPNSSPSLGILKSPRSCDDFSEAASQALVSGDEDESLLGSPLPSSAASPKRKIPYTEPSASPPQFIMPTLTMPSRRPFTTRGKNVGRLKILIAGDSGIGKSCLIKAIVQICEDIVHVDPVLAEVPAGKSGRTTSATSSFYTLSSRAESERTRKITEVYASTKPYPRWWSEHEHSKILRKRKSVTGATEAVLERNICFVDTPGYGSGTSFAECVEPVVRYAEMQMEKTSAILSAGEGDLLSLLSGTGTPQVDIVFYVILHRLKPVDVEYIRNLSPLTSVLPIIAKADSLTKQQIKSLKLSILSDLQAAGIRPFLFGKSYEDILNDSNPCAPFAISSTISNDQENMDASVLMSPDYVPPLVETELSSLINHVLHPDNIAWLKHTAARKYINWSAKARATSPTHSTSLGLPQRSFAPSATRSTSPLLIQSSQPTFTLARLSDHTQREERFAQARLARWASELQRSLRAERERYEWLARGERAMWLTEKLNECVQDGQLVLASTPMKGKPNDPNSIRGQAIIPEALGFSVKDPLGILSSKGTMYIGYGGGILAFIAAVWALRNCGMTLAEFTDWFGFRMG